MRSSVILVGVLAAAGAASSCSSNGNSGGTPTNPGGGGTPTPTSVTISIVATMGNQSYVPNPVPVGGNEQIVFRNNDTVAHRIIMDDNSVDFGTLSPGASSPARAVATGSFHCTIHPSMVGSINTATAPEPPPGSGDGY
jgi:plastocyanin